MYSELLTGLCGEVEPVTLPLSQEELVVILVQSRHHPHDRGRGGPAVAEDLALELDHDLMLLRLCRALGIESDPGWFANPLAERERLEEALRAAGVDFRTLDDHRKVA